jgi:hypothetical protein
MSPTAAPEPSLKEQWVEFLTPIIEDVLDEVLDNVLENVQGVLDFESNLVERKREWFQNHFSNKNERGLFGKRNGDN